MINTCSPFLERGSHQLDSLHTVIFYFTENSLLTALIYYHLHFVRDNGRIFILLEITQEF